MFSNSKRSKIEPFLAIEMLTKANLLKSQGSDIVDLTVGEPYFSAIKEVKEDAINRLNIGKFGYTEALGLPSLRKAISNHYQNFYNVKISYERIGVTVGASGAFFLSALTSFDPGDRVLMSTPYYPGYVNILKSLGVDIVFKEGKKDSYFQPTFQDIKSSLDNVKGVIVASPANPTGSIIPRREMEQLAKLCKLKNIILIVDEIYHGITYEEKSPDTVFNYNEDAIIINSFSKYFAMTGWRLGWVVLPERFIQPFQNLAMNFFLSPSSLSQFSALRAFTNYAALNGYVKKYKINRDYLLDNFPKIGLNKFAPPQGAFYLYVDVSEYTSNSISFVQEMLVEANVACVSGIDFDAQNGRDYVRFSYACKYEDILKAVERINQWFKRKY